MNRFDVVVIGGGLIGCAAAYYLSKSGATVLLVEQGELNREASGRNAGSLHFQLEYRLTRYGEDQAAQFAQIIPLSLVAIEDWARLEADLEADLEVDMQGGLIVAETPADVELLEKRQSLQERWGLPTVLWSSKDLRRHAPYLADNVHVLAAAFCAREGHANPRLVAPAFARGAASLGATIRCRTRVTAIERDGSAWQLATITDENSREKDVEAIRAGALLNAAGAWSGEIAAMAHLHLPIFAVPLSMNVLERSAPLIPHLVQHASRRLTVKQVADGNILIGGGWPGRFARTNGIMDPRRPAAVPIQNAIDNLILAARLVPAVRRLNLIRCWAGTTGVTSDQMPLLGEVPEAPGFYVAAGGSGFTHGPTYARLISELISGKRPSQGIDLYSPSRFSHVNNFMAAV